MTRNGGQATILRVQENRVLRALSMKDTPFRSEVIDEVMAFHRLYLHPDLSFQDFLGYALRPQFLLTFQY